MSGKCLLVLLLWCGCAPRIVPAAQTPGVKIILDTDMGPDADDAGALAMLHALADQGEAEILATLCSTMSPWAAPCLNAINLYYQRPDLPVGTLKEGTYAGTSEEWYGDSFNGFIAGHFPNPLRHGAYAPDALWLYRRVLALQPDASVVIAVTGPLTNLRNLQLAS
jgi:inosine-uridine nucleoside N-ribohydrolase